MSLSCISERQRMGSDETVLNETLASGLNLRNTRLLHQGFVEAVALTYFSLSLLGIS